MTRQVLVTGGTSGIGRAIAAAFAREGDRVGVTGRTAEETAQLPRMDLVTAQQLDVTQPGEIGALIAEMESLDVLVNAAGTIQRDQREHDPEVFDQVIDVNLSGTMRVCASARPL